MCAAVLDKRSNEKTRTLHEKMSPDKNYLVKERCAACGRSRARISALFEGILIDADEEVYLEVNIGKEHRCVKMTRSIAATTSGDLTAKRTSAIKI